MLIKSYFLGFTGENCQYEIDECQSNPCLNDGYCIDEIGDFKCACDLGKLNWRKTLCLTLQFL